MLTFWDYFFILITPTQLLIKTIGKVFRGGERGRIVLWIHGQVVHAFEQRTKQ